MDSDRFDRLARTVAAMETRRGVIRHMTRVLLGSWVGFRLTPHPSATHAQDLPLPPLARAACRRQLYDTDGKPFRGVPIEAHPDFFPALDAIDQCAVTHGVEVEATGSLRDPNVPVRGAIVDPAEYSNHHAGHAIDTNVWYMNSAGDMQRCASSCMDGNNRPQAVTDFIRCVKAAGLRWGGNFRNPKSDPVHFDDGLNLSDPNAFRRKVADMGDSVECSACDPCNLKTALCEDICTTGTCNTKSGVCEETTDPCDPSDTGVGQCR